ncbi:formimidoylglutamate deiminase [Maritalea porphyrae]|uniref:formimidoylglutamate deiminase n=1 Tax=Maritalea porphyrae TaxID=880732 RepID=UPI0022B01843|nr:formimidoylglutamate deiminase [Maritalea porphyrae]MCZ4272135.1 formimidoylglutamate deiminase [Maritalea porphyrae]
MQHIFAKSALLPNGWATNVRLSIEGGKIFEVETNAIKQKTDTDLGEQLLLPAISNVHSHSFQRAMAGLSERRGASTDSFWTWRDVMYRFLDQLSVDDIHAIAAFTFMEMAEAGFAAVGEFHYVHHQTGGTRYNNVAETSLQIIDAAQEVGLGLTHLPVLYSFGGVNGEPLKGGQQRFGSDFNLFARMVEGAQSALRTAPADYHMGVAPHSLRAVNKDLLAQVTQLLPGAPVHMHIAEQLAEVDDVKTHWGARPVEWLLENAPVDKHWCLIHCTHMTPEETIGLADTGAVAGLCPITEANLGDGIFEAVRFVEHGGQFGIGSDSDLRISLAEELRTLEHSQRYKTNQRTVLAKPHGSNAQFLLQSAAAGGAQALGRQSGRIEAGQWADLFSLDPQLILADGLSESLALDYWMFAGRNDNVHNLWSAGRHIVKDGQHINRASFELKFRQTLRKLRALL